MSAAVSPEQPSTPDSAQYQSHHRNSNGGGAYATISESETSSSITTSSSTSAMTTINSNSSIFKSSSAGRSSSYQLHQQHLRSAYGASEEMLETEKASLVERVSDLERVVLEQKDEIVCLKSTLADVLRRLSTLDNSFDSGKTMQESNNSSSSVMSSKSFRFSRNTITRLNSSVDEKRFGRVPSRVTSSPSRSAMSASHGTAKASSLAQKAIHHSNGSLHSDSMSSHSISPAPSPSPRQPNLQNLSASVVGTIGVNGGAANGVGAGMGKRWSSTGDFVSGGSPGTPVSSASTNSISRFSTKSLLNLNSSLGGHNGSGKAGSHAFVQRKDDDDFLKLYISGRPIVLHIPEAQISSYETTKVQPAPNKRLRLDWVYGYRGKDCRSNLHQLPTGEMVYFVAAVVILYNMDEQSQRHYVGHTDDVKSLAVHPNKLLVASGQCGGHDGHDTLPHIRVWNSVSLATLNVIGMGDFTGAINCLSFSRADSGTILAAIDDSPDKIISIWDWQKKENGRRITETKCSVDTIVAVEFHPLDKGQIITIGKNHIAFWSLDQNGMLYKRMGVFENREKPKYVTAITF